MDKQESMHPVPPLVSAFAVGGVAVLLVVIVLGILHLPLSTAARARLLGGLVVFCVAAGWYHHLNNWEDRVRRMTATSLHGVGVLLLFKAITSQSLQHMAFGSVLVTHGGDAPLSVRFLMGMASTSWQWDVGAAILGFLMLLAVQVYARSPSARHFGDAKAAAPQPSGATQNVVSVQVVNELSSVIPEARPPTVPNSTCSGIPLTYDTDLPPLVEVWVGRNSEMDLLRETTSGVVAITGIGGQGKSSLAAKVLADRRKGCPAVFWDWRDCRSESNRFRTQLLSVIEHYTNGEVSADTLAEADVTWLTKYIFRRLQDRKAVLIFDNVDHYVNIEQSLFVSDVSAFINEALRVDHSSLVIFTCRPRISYPSVRFREVYLRGLSQGEAIELFSHRIPGKLEGDFQEIVKQFHSLTDGHPLWLNIIASQVGRKKDSAKLILESLQVGEVDERARAMLRGIWQSLSDRKRCILRSMAEFPRAMTADAIFEYVAASVGPRRRFDRALRGLTAISLITGKGGTDAAEPRYDLHPIVMGFIRKEYGGQGERYELLDSLILCCKNIVIRLRSDKKSSRSIETLEQMTTQTELEISRGSISEAVKTLDEASDALVARGLHEELLRLGGKILELTDWQSSDWIGESSFSELVRTIIQTAVEQGRTDSIRPILDKYTSAAEPGTTEYIDVCQLNAYVEWFNGNHGGAISHADRGIRLKKRGGVDTSRDCEHIRALAMRDSGRTAEALQVFLSGNDLESVAGEDHLASKRPAAFYGNIGRCLQLQGKTDEALALYAKSYDILDRHDSATSVLNKGYAALWLGEALTEAKRDDEAQRFLELAFCVWSRRASHKADIPGRLLGKAPVVTIIDPSVERKLLQSCKAWVVDHLEMA